ncbi:putative diguanylate cyclase AdrA [Marinomonas spartinae]|uniref:diguanylate cyclase n=2 Tax=Marinomonas spartinae TaxID=1792290 RepID=A0A1A8TUF0_9GAMM|nr:putative diguanylate cyclase AdrA [Marinomonas spartinae]
MEMDPHIFPCGLMVSDFQEQKILQLNAYIENEFGFAKESLIGQPITALFTKASILFLEHYFYPMLLQDGKVSELQVMLLSAKKEPVPVTINATLSQQGKIHWALFSAINRDQLYQELINTRDKLEDKTKALTITSATDELTGLLNRREATKRANEMIQQTKRADLMLSFILLDIDYFKRVNDTFGHQKGDKILIEMSKVLVNTVRSCDIVARWGGEEFLIVLYNTPIDKANTFCQRLHDRINQIAIGRDTLHVSIGMTGYPIDKQALNLDEIIWQADEALYDAKERGRNQTRLFKESLLLDKR